MSGKQFQKFSHLNLKCDFRCGGGLQERTRQISVPQQCSNQYPDFECPFSPHQARPCNEGCPNGGQPSGTGSCNCPNKFEGPCCQRGKINLQIIELVCIPRSLTLHFMFNANSLKLLVRLSPRFAWWLVITWAHAAAWSFFNVWRVAVILGVKGTPSISLETLGITAIIWHIKKDHAESLGHMNK